MTLSIDEISLFVCGCGGNGMCSHIYYSTDNFETRTAIFEMKKMPANNMQYVESKPVIKLEEGQELLIRVYPWYNGSATGKTICLSDLSIHGMATDGTAGVHTIDTPHVVGQRIYSIDGCQQSTLRHGLNIICREQPDGTIRTTKTIYK
ncbi:MAG: hypothetical protein IJK42_02195, partial [Prevotella sp.]|nr:hypothetical protein [Prevotella sp.]